MKAKQKIVIKKDGPYIVSGNIPLAKEFSLVGESGQPETWEQGESYPQQEAYALCRCGKSKTKPFCDHSHEKSYFDGTERASKETYLEQAEVLDGPELELTDAEVLCSLARFCHL